MSVRCCRAPRGKRTASIAWLLCILVSSMLFSPTPGYVILNSVSWSVTSEVEEELDSSSTEEALPALLEDTGNIWKQSYTASAHKGDGGPKPRPGADRAKQVSSPSRMFSYRREGAKDTEGPSPPSGSHQEPGAKAARFVAHSNSWGFLATHSTQEKIHGEPFGIVLSVSDGPAENSTGVPFFCVTPKGSVVSDLMKNPMASLTLPETDICRKNTLDPDDPRCARLTLTGQMVTVPPEETDFAKRAMFSRHPEIRKWPRSYDWFFMKMIIEHISLQNWYGGITTIDTDKYFKAAPSSD